MGLYRTISKTNVDFGGNTQIFSYPRVAYVVPPLNGYPLRILQRGMGLKKTRMKDLLYTAKRMDR